MSARDFVEPLVDSARDAISTEIDYWRDEATRPWREGRPGRAARTGRWIGFGLATGAAIVGILAALRVERPWR